MVPRIKRVICVMKKEIEEAFKRVNASYVKDEQVRQKAADQKKSEQERRIAAWKGKTEDVVTPALEEIADRVLRPAGWTCIIGGAHAGKPGVSMQVFREGMGIGGSASRPNISFFMDRTGEIWSHSQTRSQTGGDSPRLILDQITTEKVQECALTFFEWLAGERGYN